MGKTVSVILYIKVSVFSLVFGCLCCVCVSFVVVVVVAVHCFCLFCFGFFLLCLAFCFFGFVAALVNLFHLRSVKYTEALHTDEGPEVRKGALVVGLEMDGGAYAPTSKCEYIF